MPSICAVFFHSRNANPFCPSGIYLRFLQLYIIRFDSKPQGHSRVVQNSTDFPMSFGILFDDNQLSILCYPSHSASPARFQKTRQSIMAVAVTKQLIDVRG